MDQFRRKTRRCARWGGLSTAAVTARNKVTRRLSRLLKTGGGGDHPQAGLAGRLRPRRDHADQCAVPKGAPNMLRHASPPHRIFVEPKNEFALIQPAPIQPTLIQPTLIQPVCRRSVALTSERWGRQASACWGIAHF